MGANTVGNGVDIEAAASTPSPSAKEEEWAKVGADSHTERFVCLCDIRISGILRMFIKPTKLASVVPCKSAPMFWSSLIHRWNICLQIAPRGWVAYIARSSYEILIYILSRPIVTKGICTDITKRQHSCCSLPGVFYMCARQQCV